MEMQEARHYAVAVGALLVATSLQATPKPQGPPFQVNTTTAGAQVGPQVEARGDRFLVIWANEGLAGGTRTSGQQLDLDGGTVGGEFTVPGSDAYHQGSPRVALSDNGDFLIQWKSSANVGGTIRPAVRARAFNADTTPAEPAFLVATEGFEYPSIPSHEVAATLGGTFVIALSRFHFQGLYSYGNVTKFLRTTDGADIGTTNLASSATPLRLERGQHGAFVVALLDADDYAGNQYFRIHRLDEDGIADGGSFTVLRDDYQFNIGSGHVALQPNDDIEVVWHQDISGSNEIFGIHVGSDNLPDGDRFQINTHTLNGQINPRIAAVGETSFLVVWQSFSAPAGDTDSSGWSIRGRQLSATGEPMGESFQVNEVTTGDQISPVVAAAPDGNSFIVAWQSQSSDGGDTSSWSIRARRYSVAQSLFTDGFESGDTSAWDAVTR